MWWHQCLEKFSLLWLGAVSEASCFQKTTFPVAPLQQQLCSPELAWHKYCGVENVTRASVCTGLRRKWLTFPFWLNFSFEGRTVGFNRSHQSRREIFSFWGLGSKETVVRFGVSDCYLSGAETHHQVSDEGVFCFSWAMAHHHTPAVLLGQLAPKGVKPGWRPLQWMQVHCLQLMSVHNTLWCPQSVIRVVLNFYSLPSQ